MFTSFMLNLRRFYRTSLIEMYVANMLAVQFRREDMHDFLHRCREIDKHRTGFFTASDLKHVLTVLGHGSVSEAITHRFLRAFRHPGESYIDYIAMLDSILLRQQRMFEEAFWQHFQRVCRSSGCEPSGWISLSELGMLFSDPAIVGLLMHEIPESAGVEEASVCHWLQSGIRQHCVEQRTMRLDFRCLSALLLKLVRSYTVPKDLVGWADAEPDEGETVSSVL
jgi:Ca2+-binding EF-hand superfamily protein